MMPRLASTPGRQQSTVCPRTFSGSRRLSHFHRLTPQPQPQHCPSAANDNDNDPSTTNDSPPPTPSSSSSSYALPGLVIRDPRGWIALAVLLRIIQHADWNSVLVSIGASMMWPSWQFGIAAIFTMVPFSMGLWFLTDYIIKSRLDQNRGFMSLLLVACSIVLGLLYYSNNQARYEYWSKVYAKQEAAVSRHVQEREGRLRERFGLQEGRLEHMGKGRTGTSKE